MCTIYDLRLSTTTYQCTQCYLCTGVVLQGIKNRLSVLIPYTSEISAFFPTNIWVHV